MTPLSVFPKSDLLSFGGLASGGLFSKLEKDGRMPPISIIIKPLLGREIVLDRFLSYQFQSSILIPVDTFSFSFASPDGPPLTDSVNCGDIVVLTANDVTLATGIIDTTETETEAEYGEKSTLTGRDLMGQLEDQSAISLNSKPIWANEISVRAGVEMLIEDTRVNGVETREAPLSNYLPATEPGESKLAALQRFLEPLNCVAWMGSRGQMIVGKPNMSQLRRGTLMLSREKRMSNVLSARVTRAATSIANVVVPIWSGQETVVDRVPTQQRIHNAAPGPSRLYKLGHIVPKTVVVSAPNATDPQGLSAINALKAAGGNILQAYAKREIARENVQEIIFQCVVPGHFNELGEPYVVDTVYNIEYDRGGLFEDMYLFQVEYQLDGDNGQRSVLHFCRFGSIVSDIRAP